MKLNLGCGIYYKPGYVNIDKFEALVADQLLDINQLPYGDNSVDEIEASHVLEHFDCLQIPYVLSEWFRILKPGGIILIETPHLVQSVGKVAHAPLVKQLITLRFLFGVDIVGNVHKMGFTPSILKKILLSIGFCNVRNLHPQRFDHEKGLRVKAEKPALISKSDKIIFLVGFRNKIMTHFKNPGTLFLEAIENNVMGPLYKILPSNADNYFTSENLVKFLAHLAILNPQIALIFSSLFEKKRMEGLHLHVLQFLRDNNAPMLFLGNWIRWNKSPIHLFFSLTKFYSHWVKKIEDSIRIGTVNERDFQYLLTSGTEQVNYFSPEIITISALKHFNQGVKAFSMQDFDQAKVHFLQTLKLDPSNSFAYWNLARLSKHFKGGGEKIQKYYHLAMTFVMKRTLRRTIKRELEGYDRSYETDPNNILPVQT